MKFKFARSAGSPGTSHKIDPGRSGLSKDIGSPNQSPDAVQRIAYSGQPLASNPFNTIFVSEKKLEEQKEEKKEAELQFQKFNSRPSMNFSMARTGGGSSGPTHRIDEGRSRLRIEIGDPPAQAAQAPQTILDTSLNVLEYWTMSSLSGLNDGDVVQSWIGNKSLATFVQPDDQYAPMYKLNNMAPGYSGVYFSQYLSGNTSMKIVPGALSSQISLLNKMTWVIVLIDPLPIVSKTIDAVLNYGLPNNSVDAMSGSAAIMLSNGSAGTTRFIGAVPDSPVTCYTTDYSTFPFTSSVVISTGLHIVNGCEFVRFNLNDQSINDGGDTSGFPTFGNNPMYLGAQAEFASGSWQFSGSIGAIALISGTLAEISIEEIEEIEIALASACGLIL